MTIKYKKFSKDSIDSSTLEAIVWIQDNNINVINMFEYRFFWYHGGIIVVYNTEKV